MEWPAFAWEGLVSNFEFSSLTLTAAYCLAELPRVYVVCISCIKKYGCDVCHLKKYDFPDSRVSKNYLDILQSNKRVAIIRIEAAKNERLKNRLRSSVGGLDAY
jgi:hypothetical protein